MLVGVKATDARSAAKRLGRYDFEPANSLRLRLVSSYGHTTDGRVPVRVADREEFRLLRKVATPEVLRCRYLAVYRWTYTSSLSDELLRKAGLPKKVKKEVLVKSKSRPPKKRVFRIAGVGARRFRLIYMYDAITKKETTVAKSGTKTKPKDEDVEKIEGLEDIEDLEDLEDSDFEEPEAEKEEADDNGLSSLSLKALRAKAKEAGIRGASKKSKEDIIALLSESDEEEDDEEEDDGLDEMDRSALKARLKELDSDAKVKKSESDDDLRTRIRALAEDEEEEDEEPTPAPKKSSGKKPDAKANGRKPPTPPNRELPTGKLGASEVAEMAGVTGRDVRVFLRKNKEKFPKNEELGRYAFSKKEAEKLVKALKKAA